MTEPKDQTYSELLRNPKFLLVMGFFAVASIFSELDTNNDAKRSSNAPFNETAASLRLGQKIARVAENDMQKGGAKASRDADLCKIVTSMAVENWTGRISSIEADSKGRGYLGIEIADDVKYLQTQIRTTI